MSPQIVEMSAHGLGMCRCGAHSEHSASYLMPVSHFILTDELFFHSRVSQRMLHLIDRLFGDVPRCLRHVAVAPVSASE